MSTLGTRECSQPDSNDTRTEETFWVAVKVERGFAAEVGLFRTEKSARLQEEKWRKGMNIEYDDADVFEVPVESVTVA